MTQTELSAFLIEYKSHNRILEDSKRLFETTNNFEVFKVRAELLCENVMWFFDQKSKGKPLKLTQTQSEFEEEFNEKYNFHLVRIAKHICANATTKGRKEKALQVINEMLMLIHFSDNWKETRQELEQLKQGLTNNK